jgi:hypothetical protein
MLPVLIAAAVAAATQTPGLEALDGLAGCWKAPGQVRGKDATSVARGEWHMGGRYFILHVQAVAAKDPYEAAILYGAGDKPERLTSFWMDSLGGAFSTSGAGAATADGFGIDYRYPDAVYTNRFTREGKGWRWTILEHSTGKPQTLFAEYRLTPASCRGMTFSF